MCIGGPAFAGLEAPQETEAPAHTAPGPWEFGVVIGIPTGYSATYNLDRTHSIDTAAGWSFSSDPAQSGGYLHMDYLWRTPHILGEQSEAFGLHYGLGMRLIAFTEARNDGRPTVGARFPVGMDYRFGRDRFEVFGEAAFVMDVTPASRADVDFSAGLRFRF